MQSLLRFALIFAVGCSADTFVVADGGTDAGSDASDAASDAAKDGGAIEAGTFECNVGTCATPTAPVCCGNFSLGTGPNITACSILSASTKCTTATGCPTTFPIACSSKGEVRLCADPQDCDSDPVAKKCCNVYGGGVMGWVCATDAVANLGFTCK